MRVQPVLARVRRRAEEVRTPGELLPGVRRLVVVRQDRVGDFVLTLPAVDALRRAYPDAELAVLVDPALVPLARCVAGVDRVLAALPGVGTLAEALRGFDPDLVVCVSRGGAAALAAARSGATRRVGTGYRYYSSLFTRRVNERRRTGGRHEVEYALSFAHRVGAAPGPARFPLGEDEAAARETREWLGAARLDAGYVVLHPGSAGSCPRWPVEHFLELARRLVDEGVRPVWTLGPQDDDVVAALGGAPPVARGLPVFRRSLPALSALVARAALVVSHSTAPIHLAAARGAPALALHAPWATCGVGRWGPYDDRGFGLVAEAEEAREWSHRERARGSAALMAAISPAVVARCARAILSGSALPGPVE